MGYVFGPYCVFLVSFIVLQSPHGLGESIILLNVVLLSCSFQSSVSLPRGVVGSFVIYDCRFS